MDSFLLREEDYAVRIVIYLATVDKMVKMQEISENLFLSKPIVAKIVNKLKSSGFLVTKTGKNGGLTVSDSVYEASLYDILLCMGFTARLNQCLHPKEGCRLMPICKVNSLFCDLQTEFEQRLKDAKVKEFLFKNKGQ